MKLMADVLRICVTLAIYSKGVLNRNLLLIKEMGPIQAGKDGRVFGLIAPGLKTARPHRSVDGASYPALLAHTLPPFGS
jgi:hypothetical protein